MNAPAFNRRQFTAGLGALVVGFSLDPKLALGQEPPRLPGSLQGNRKLDGWIRINSDGTATILTDSAQVADFMRGGECRFGFIDTRREKIFVQRAEANGLRYSAGPRIEAINIGGGERITIAVFRSGAPQ